MTLIEIDRTLRQLRLSGFAALPAYARATRDAQYFFVNGRFVRDKVIAHALREHARERLAKTQATGIGLSLGAKLLGLGELGNTAANLGTQLLSLKFSRSDETEADLVGLELAARAGFDPQAAVRLWQKMGQATGGSGGIAFLSTHPSGPERIRELQQNVPKVQGLYQAARRQ